VRALYGQAAALPASLFELGISPYINASIIITWILAMPEQLVSSWCLALHRHCRFDTSSCSQSKFGCTRSRDEGLRVSAPYPQALPYRNHFSQWLHCRCRPRVSWHGLEKLARRGDRCVQHMHS
jgi:hypothetical protein